MEAKEYLKLSEVTERKFPDGCTLEPYQVSMLEEAIYYATKAGIEADTLKRSYVYGKEGERVRYYELDGNWFEGINLTSEEAEMLHASLGMVTEAIEFFESVYKSIKSGSTLDKVNLKEEIGDQTWYQALALRLLDSTFEEVMETNTEKLKARYGDKFDAVKAVERDLNKEREVLEK